MLRASITTLSPTTVRRRRTSPWVSCRPLSALGFFARPLAPGNYTVIGAADGFVAQAVAVEVSQHSFCDPRATPVLRFVLPPAPLNIALLVGVTVGPAVGVAVLVVVLVCVWRRRRASLGVHEHAALITEEPAVVAVTEEGTGSTSAAKDGYQAAV